MTDHHHSIGAEAHHHAKGHGGKNWKTYFFEFFMLFFAVFCGFQAEYLLEHKIERDREKQFIVSMVKEIQMDSKELSLVQNDSNRYRNLDTLTLNILGGDRSIQNMKRIYENYWKYATNMWFMRFGKNTLTQLKNAGNMRLIRNMSVVDSLNELDNKISYTERSLDHLDKEQLENMRLWAKIVNPVYSIKNGKWVSFEEFRKNVRVNDFITGDKQILREIGNDLHVQGRYG